MNWFKDGFKRRGIIYIVIGILGIAYELLFSKVIRPVVLVLWSGIIGIGVIVMLYFKDRNTGA